MMYLVKKTPPKIKTIYTKSKNEETEKKHK